MLFYFFYFYFHLKTLLHPHTAALVAAGVSHMLEASHNLKKQKRNKGEKVANRLERKEEGMGGAEKLRKF